VGKENRLMVRFRVEVWNLMPKFEKGKARLSVEFCPDEPDIEIKYWRNSRKPATRIATDEIRRWYQRIVSRQLMKRRTNGLQRWKKMSVLNDRCLMCCKTGVQKLIHIDHIIAQFTISKWYREFCKTLSTPNPVEKKHHFDPLLQCHFYLAVGKAWSFMQKNRTELKGHAASFTPFAPRVSLYTAFKLIGCFDKQFFRVATILKLKQCWIENRIMDFLEKKCWNS